MKFKKAESHNAEVDMTPMIDIVFQLIAFFMVAINFEQMQADERVKLPRDRLAKPAEVKRDNELVLNVGYDRNERGERTDRLGRVDPDAPALVFYAGDPTPVLNFAPKLKLEQQVFKDTGVDPREVTVVIRADSEVPTGLVQQLIKMAQEASFEKFAVKATQARDDT
ncbi:MAG TPA: biopolymer transporter ExbD [Planctomycetaceae bacterium]|nr:biopolymer transporter ExbD [Planctomycetaceae bacterium]